MQKKKKKNLKKKKVIILGNKKNLIKFRGLLLFVMQFVSIGTNCLHCHFKTLILKLHLANRFTIFALISLWPKLGFKFGFMRFFLIQNKKKRNVYSLSE